MQTIIPELVTFGFVEGSIRDRAIEVESIAGSQISLNTRVTTCSRKSGKAGVEHTICLLYDP